jgi:hypothetical protein
MSKSAVLSSEIIAPAVPAVEAVAAPSAVTPRPGFVTITEPIHVAMSAAAHLIRNGYVPCAEAPPEIFLNTGYAIITLQLGSPDQRAVDAANEALDLAEAVRQREYDKAVAADVQKALAQAKRDAEQAELAAKIAEQKLAIRRLEAQLA